MRYNPLDWVIEKIERLCLIIAILYLVIVYCIATEALASEMEKDAKEVSE